MRAWARPLLISRPDGGQSRGRRRRTRRDVRAVKASAVRSRFINYSCCLLGYYSGC